MFTGKSNIDALLGTAPLRSYSEPLCQVSDFSSKYR